MESSSLSSINAHAASQPLPSALPLVLHECALRALTPREARLARLLADGRLNALLAHAFGLGSWAVSPPGRFEASMPGVIELRRGEETALVAIDLSYRPALASTALPETGHILALDTELRMAVASILLAPVCKALEMIGICDVRVAAVRAGEPKPDTQCNLLSFRVGEHTLRLGLLQVADSWLDVIEQLVASQCMPFTPRVSQLAVPGRLQIGAKTLSVTALESLRPGDVVLRAVRHPPAALLSAEPEPLSAPMVWGNPGMRQLCCMARVRGDKLTLTGAPYMTYESHDGEASPAVPGDAPVSISDLDLPVKIEIDTVSLPVAQLSALRAGYVLELPVPLRDAHVRLVSYGQTVGFGELVAVGEHIGVRILRMSHQSDPV